MKVTLFWALADCRILWAIGYGDHTGTFHIMYIILVWNYNFIPIVCCRLRSSLCLRYCVLCLCFFYYFLVKLQKGNEIILCRRNAAYLWLIGSVFVTEIKGRSLTDLKRRALIYPYRRLTERAALGKFLKSFLLAIRFHCLLYLKQFRSSINACQICANINYYLGRKSKIRFIGAEHITKFYILEV